MKSASVLLALVALVCCGVYAFVAPEQFAEAANFDTGSTFGSPYPMGLPIDVSSMSPMTVFYILSGIISAVTAAVGTFLMRGLHTIDKLIAPKATPGMTPREAYLARLR